MNRYAPFVKEPSQRLAIFFFSAISIAQLAVLWFAAYKILSVVFILAILSFLIFFPKDNQKPKMPRAMLVSYASVYTYMALSTLWAPRPWDAAFDVGIALAATLPPFIFGIFASRYFTLSEIGIGLAISPLLFAFQAVYSAIVYDDPMLIDEFSIRTIFGALTCMVTPLILSLYLSNKKIAPLMLFLISFGCAVLIGSRSAMLIVLPAVFYILYGKKPQIAIMTFVFLAFLGVLIFMFSSNNATDFRLNSSNSNLDISESVLMEVYLDKELRIDFDRRLAAYLSYENFLSSPIVGHGYSSVFQRIKDEFDRDIVSHGFFPGTLSELGIVGILIIVNYILISFKYLKFWIRIDSVDRQLKIGYAVGFISLLAFGFFHQTFESAFFSMVAGILTGSMHKKYNNNYSYIAKGHSAQVVAPTGR